MVAGSSEASREHSPTTSESDNGDFRQLGHQTRPYRGTVSADDSRADAPMGMGGHRQRELGSET
ncbi:hypothetical protein HUE57_04895 [Candidatus Reidiella endopervernicosa]|uniref:Uncharacterized protein n=2 Tax=Candidatus Reidiella endopervernicosa TaxID=2738883 RepID=A0A6N0HU59_9GAMM|nr:hypothetical protein HUE57_04895 [Candidatus Reidiella endopervernicosa]